MKDEIFVEQLDSILESYSSINTNDIGEAQRIASRGIAAVHRISGPNSSYSENIDRVVAKLPFADNHVDFVIGVVKALREDVNSGYLKSLQELAHADVFSDFLEQASHLVESGYKDAAAVLTGSTLESHLKKLAVKNAISIADARGTKKASRINDELAKGEVYSTLDQKSVTSWLSLRNEAAHGNYIAYTKDQVSLMIQSVQDFITRTPA